MLFIHMSSEDANRFRVFRDLQRAETDKSFLGEFEMS